MAFNDNEFLEWEKEIFSISDFIDEFRDTLPRVMRVEEGFCGVNEECSLDATEVLVFHETIKQRRFLANDDRGRTISISSNCPHKVQLIPEDCECECYSIKNLKAVCPRYFQVLDPDGIPGTCLKAGTLWKITEEQNSDESFLNCQNITPNDSNYGRNEKIPLMLRGKFLPLQDCGEYHLSEVTSMVAEISSLRIRFTHSTDCCISDSISITRLDQLGVLKIEKEYREEMIFATTWDRRHMLIFPKGLDVLITPSKEDALVESSPYAKSLQAKATTKPDLRRFKLLNQENAFFVETPLMAFDYKKFIRRPTLAKPRRKATQSSKPAPMAPIPCNDIPPPIPPKSPKKKMSPSPFVSPKKTRGGLRKSSSCDDAKTGMSRERTLKMRGPPPLPPRREERSHSDSDLLLDDVTKCYESDLVAIKQNEKKIVQVEIDNTKDPKSETVVKAIEENDPKRPTLPPRKKRDQKAFTPIPKPRKIHGEVRRFKPLPAPRKLPPQGNAKTEKPCSNSTRIGDDQKIVKDEENELPLKPETKHTEDPKLDSVESLTNKCALNVSAVMSLSDSPVNHKIEIEHNICRKNYDPPPLPPKLKTRGRSHSSPCLAFNWNIIVDIPLDKDENNNDDSENSLPLPLHKTRDETDEMLLLRLGKRPQTIGSAEKTAWDSCTIKDRSC